MKLACDDGVVHVRRVNFISAGVLYAACMYSRTWTVEAFQRFQETALECPDDVPTTCVRCLCAPPQHRAP